MHVCINVKDVKFWWSNLRPGGMSTDDANDDNTGRTIHDYIASLAFMPNEPISTIIMLVSNNNNCIRYFPSFKHKVTWIRSKVTVTVNTNKSNVIFFKICNKSLHINHSSHVKPKYHDDFKARCFDICFIHFKRFQFYFMKVIRVMYSPGVSQITVVFVFFICWTTYVKNGHLKI